MDTVTASAWTATVSNKTGGDYESPEKGSHPAVCVGVVDLGTHTSVFNGEGHTNRRILFAFELTAENKADGTTFVVVRDFNLTLKSSKANLRQFLESWEGRSFNDQEQVDFLGYLGRPCVVNIVEDTSKKGNTFTTIASVVKPMRGLAVPPRTRELVCFLLDERTSTIDPVPIPDDWPYLYGVPIVEVIQGSEEWGKLPGF